MKSRITSPRSSFPRVALLLPAAAFVGYQTVSAQNSPGSPDGDPPPAPTG